MSCLEVAACIAASGRQPLALRCHQPGDVWQGAELDDDEWLVLVDDGSKMFIVVSDDELVVGDG